MNNRQSKKWRRRFHKQINSASSAALKNEIFRLARNRDILGLLAILEFIALVILLIIIIR